MSNIDETLGERGNTHGDFQEQAIVSQGIKRSMRYSRNWDSLSDDKREALEMLSVKISRILTGDPEYTDHWHDIKGYVKRVEDSLVNEV